MYHKYIFLLIVLDKGYHVLKIEMRKLYMTYIDDAPILMHFYYEIIYFQEFSVLRSVLHETLFIILIFFW